MYIAKLYWLIPESVERFKLYSLLLLCSMLDFQLFKGIWFAFPFQQWARQPTCRCDSSSLVTYSLLYRHECFTGKYTSRKIHKNYIRDPSGVFSIILHEFIDDVILVIPLYYFIDVILSI